MNGKHDRRENKGWKVNENSNLREKGRVESDQQTVEREKDGRGRREQQWRREKEKGGGK